MLPPTRRSVRSGILDLRALRRRSSVYAFISLLLLAAALPRAAAAAVFNPESFTLANGLQVVVLTNDRLPVVSQMVWYKVGAADDPSGKSGLAHFLEHLMFRGTTDIAPGEFSRIVSRNGGVENAFTNSDATAYYQTVAADRLELVMKLEADRMANLALDEDQVVPERQVIIEERRTRTENNPGALLRERMNAALFLNHPYGRPVIGWRHEMAGLTRDDAIAFYKHHYAPDNAILIVSGDVTVAKVRELAEKYYGPIKSAHIPPRVRLKEPPQIAARRVTLESDRVREPRLMRTYLAPSYTTGATKDAYALQVLEIIMSGGATSRLYSKLVVEDETAVSAYAAYDVSNYDYGSFTVGGQPRGDVSVSALETAIDAQIARLLKDGVTQAEVDHAKQQLIASATYARDSLRQGAQVIGTALTTGQTIADAEAWPERIQAVTVEQVNAAARDLFDITQSVTGILLPAKTEKRS
jgi:zinc protease